MEKKISRGIRNNNPGNIRLSNDPWQGLAEVQNDKEFFQFKSMSYGIRAIARTLITYQDKYGIHTIKDFVARYAPEKENDTANYKSCVCGISGFSEEKILNFHQYEDLEPVIRGILFIENGASNYSSFKQNDIDRGLKLAGVEPPAKPLVKSRTMQGASIAAVSGITLAIEAINNTADHIGNWYPWLGTLIMLGGLGYVFYARVNDQRRGK